MSLPACSCNPTISSSSTMHTRSALNGTPLPKSKTWSAPMVSHPTVNTAHPRLISVKLPLRATSDDTSIGVTQYIGEDPNGVKVVEVENNLALGQNPYAENSSPEVPKEEIPVDEQAQSFELLEKVNLKVQSEDALPILVYGSGALLALWLASTVVGAIDSIPLFPKLMEVVGLAYTFWFSSRYLIFKKNREELGVKISDLKQQVLGSDDD